MRFYKYRSDATYRPTFGGFSFLPPVLRFLLFANAGIFLLGMFFGNVRLAGGTLEEYIAYYLYLWPIGSHLFRPWQLITYMFLHADFWHVFMNMLMLWMFGVELEQIWGSRQFAIYYLICGLGGAAGQLFIAPLFGDAAPTLGASGAIFGVLLAFGLMFPDRLIYFYFFIPIKAKYFVLIYVGIEVFALGGHSNVAHLAHLGGAAAGLLYLLLEDKVPLGSWFGGLGRSFAPKSPITHVPGGRSVDAKFEEVRHDPNNVTQDTIDRILDKISKTGYQNLTDEEKQILFEASKNIH